jgi:hypothetical protein
VVLFLCTPASPYSHTGSARDGETGEEANKLTSPRNHNSRCAVYAVAGEETDKSSCKAVDLYADVEVAEREGPIVVVEDAVLKMVEDDVGVVGLPCRRSYRRTWGAMVTTEMHQGSHCEKGRCRSQRSQGRRRHRRKATTQSRQTG